ncbi:MAG: hypothetical protein NXI23_20015 [Bacteroidetes bacterium]|jgi:hypothetical protein|nr:hypothetical protein [Bacteroidota bacterium]
MKNNSFFSILVIGLMLFSLNIIAQTDDHRPSVAVLHIDAQGFTIDAAQMGNLTRIELSKLGNYEIIDRYDVQYLMEQNEINPDNCFGKICLLEAGKKLKVDKMFTGSVEVLSEKIVISFRLIDVGTEVEEKSQVLEFLNLRHQVQTMIGLTINKMFDNPVDENLMNKLTKQNDFESTVNIPTAEKLNLSGPRMGITFFSGDAATVFKEKESLGGYDGIPVMFQFGYQFEVKYLNSGNFQALFEFIPLITGLDQGKFIPSIAILNGLRSNRTGWEFAFGPTINVVKKADGYFDENNQWHLAHEFISEPGTENPVLESRLDSRGNFELSTGFAFALGKTFKSGKLNIPVNAFYVPGKDSQRFGISVGFNALAYRN